ncbi:lysophospholipid acyltransferase family protein [Nonomuraea sp. NPDC050310]|uniref:lysophospholipid acyltransferase family protein n=1 Tax=unclassified Nonomuraea TaxID=2593643 RepID=UPI0033CF633B
MSPWFPSSPCTPELCVHSTARRAAWWLRLARVLAAVAVVLGGVVAARLVRGTARRRRVTAAWSRLLLRSLGLRVHVRRGFAAYGGAGSPRPVRVAPTTLIVANHVSWLDPLVIAAALDSVPLAKREVAAWPVVGGLVAGSGALLIDRDSLHALPGTVDGIAETLRGGRSVAAFPEGTTWCGRGVGRFRPALFQAALDAGVPVRPVALSYQESGRPGSTAAAYVGEDSLLASLWRIVGTRRLSVEVTVLPPVTAADRRRLARVAEAAVLSVTGLPALEHTGSTRTLSPAAARERVSGPPENRRPALAGTS